MAGGLNLRVTTLDPKELAEVRALLADQRPEIEGQETGDYPRMLFHQSFVEAQRTWRDNPDPAMKKIASEKMKIGTVTVFDLDEEVQFLEDGWRRSPADFMEAMGLPDPRIPVGREARKAAAQQALTREQEIQALTLRLAELRGTPMSAAPAPDPGTPTPVRASRPTRRPLRRRGRAAAMAKAKAAVEPPSTDSPS